MNKRLQGKLFDSSLFANINLRPASSEGLKRQGKGMDPRRLNRMLLEDVFPAELHEADDCLFDVRQFDNFLTALQRDGLLKISHRTDPEKGNRIRERLHIRSAEVVTGQLPHRFNEKSAELFMAELNKIGVEKFQRNHSCLYIGIVSGSTTKRVIDCICAADWTIYGVSPTQWPQMKIFALNTSPTTPQDIAGNANILCYRLAEKANSYLADEHSKKAEAYGLNAAVVLDAEEMDSTDNKPQIKSILKHTETARYDKDKMKEKGETDLDLILTGAGALDPGDGDVEGSISNSIFLKLALEAKVEVAGLLKDGRLAGDLAFIPLDNNGRIVHLYDDRGKEVFFYSTARLDVFKKMSKNTDKAVFLVAASGPVSKAGIIKASKDYFSHLVIDEGLASSLT